MRAVFDILGDVKWTFWLLLLASIDLAAGSYIVRNYPEIFRPLSNILLQNWWANFGQNHFDKTWWLPALFVFLITLAVNTTVCTLKRLSSLWPKRKNIAPILFFQRICPSLIHICFSLVLAGHFLSLVVGFHGKLPIKPGAAVLLPAGSRIEILDSRLEYYIGPEMLKGFLRQADVRLKCQDGDEIVIQRLSFLQPCLWHGFSLHLGMDKKSAKTPALQIHIRRDPGLQLTLAGFIPLVILMFWQGTLFR